MLLLENNPILHDNSYTTPHHTTPSLVIFL